MADQQTIEIPRPLVTTMKQTFPGTWMTREAPFLAYRVMPKCGCSSVGQIIHYLDHGRFFSGCIHDDDVPIMKWSGGNDTIRDILATQPVFRFTLVRNPYKRLLSAFADKVFGFQRNGKKYRAGAVVRALQDYGARWGPNADIVVNFKHFVRLVADTVERGRPMKSDLHWTPCYYHLKWSARCSMDWALDYVGHVETFKHDMDEVFQRAGIDLSRVPANIPRENVTSLPDIPISTFYGPEELEIMQRVYAQDFRLFQYSHDPNQTKPLASIDVAEVNAAIRGSTEKTSVEEIAEEHPEEIVDLKGVKIPIDTVRLSPKMLREIRNGRYERQEARQVPQIVEQGERIVELGAGIGFISALAGTLGRVQHLAVYEANPQLIPMIRRTHAINNVDAEVINAALLPKADSEKVPFYIRKDFWASSLSDEVYGYKKVIHVPVVAFADMLAEHKPTMLIVDIEGGECSLFTNVPLTGIRKIYLELHPEIVGKAGTKKLFASFAANGFYLDRQFSTDRVALFTTERPKWQWRQSIRAWLRHGLAATGLLAARRKAKSGGRKKMRKKAKQQKQRHQRQ